MLFTKKRLFSDALLDDLRYDLSNEVAKPATIIDKRNGADKPGLIDPKARSCMRISLYPEEYPDYCTEILNAVEEFSPKHPASKLKVKEMEHLDYGISDHFAAHQDAHPGDKHPPRFTRRFTSITMLSKTDDMEGGELIVLDGWDGDEHPVNLQPGETVVFFSTMWHKVTPLTKGGREIIIAWVYDR